MTLEQLKARLAEIAARLDVLAAQASYEEGELDEFETLNSEAEDLQKQISLKERAANLSASAANKSPAGRQVAAVQPKSTPASVPAIENKDLAIKGSKFANNGDFFKAVARSGINGGSVGDDLRPFQAAAKESIGEDGGFLVPAEFRQEIQEKVLGDQSLLSRTTLLQTSSNNLTIPTDEVAPWDGSNGIRAFWEGEGNTLTQSKPVFGQSSFRLHKLTALVPVTEELLEDVVALDSYLRRKAPEAMMHKVNSAIIDGTGVGMPLGFLRSGFKYQQAKESGQTADTVWIENVVGMVGRILPNSFANSVWLIHPAVLQQLQMMKFDRSASSPVPVFIPPMGLSEAPYGTLMGRPILPMMGGVKALGDEGDISLVDLSCYISLVKTSGIKAEVSQHVFFDKGMSCFRFTMRMAGHIPFKTPVTTENGNFQMSAIVTLQDR